MVHGPVLSRESQVSTHTGRVSAEAVCGSKMCFSMCLKGRGVSEHSSGEGEPFHSNHRDNQVYSRP